MSERIDSIDSSQTRFGLSPAFVIFITIFIDLTGFGIIIPLLPFYVATFQAGSTALGVLVTSFSIMQFIFSPILGRISDNVGRKPVLLLSILISSISFIFFALADSFLMLLLSRVIAGTATEVAVAQAYIADITGEKERAKELGKVGAAIGAGFIIGPAIGGFLSVYGFSAPGFAAAALTLLNLLFVVLFLPESISSKGHPLVKQIESKPNIRYLHRLIDALSRPLIGASLGIFFIIFLAFSAIPVIVPLLGISFFGFGSVEMSYVFIYIGVIQIVLQGVLIGRLVRKIGEERLMAFGPLLMTFGMVLMPLIPNILVFMVSITMLSLGSGMMRTVVPSFISRRTPVEERGGILGVTQSVSTIAQVPGPLIGGSVFEFAGLAAPFLLSGTILLVAFGLGCRVFHACRRPT